METLIEQRFRRLRSKELGIVEPGGYVSYYPFDEPRYAHRHILNLNREPWPEMMSLHPEALISENPFAPSRHRNGRAVWDSTAIPQPASAEIGGQIVDKNVPALTSENTHFSKLKTIFDSMVGANTHGNPVRPAGLFVLDLTRMGEMGWLFAEAAHALAHLRCDHMCESPAFGPIIRRSMREALASLLHGCLFDVPVYVGKDEPFGTALAWPYTGFATADIENPVLSIKKDGFGSLVPDETCIQALWLYHVEPVPESYISKTVRAGTNAEWSGLPTLMAFAGWAGDDEVIHARTKIRDGDVEYHVMHAADMISPERFHEALDLAGWPGTPNLGNDWVDAKEWIKSGDFLDIASKTPSIPCKDCYMVNQRTPGAPKMPMTSSEKAWEIYEKEREECIGIAEKPAEELEIKAYFQAGLPRPRRNDRIRKNKARRKKLLAGVSEERKMERIKAKIRGEIKTPLTEKEKELLKTMKKGRKTMKESK